MPISRDDAEVEFEFASGEFLDRALDNTPVGANPTAAGLFAVAYSILTLVRSVEAADARQEAREAADRAR